MAMATFAFTAKKSNLNHSNSKNMYPELSTYIEKSILTFDGIDAERKTELAEISAYIKDKKHEGEQVNLTFICTHNSRRSHFGQIWAQVAADFYGIDGIQTFSGGTEATAFNERSVAALQRAGLKIEKLSEGKNPKYKVKWHEQHKGVEAFSKVYDEKPNPKKNFCAVMTCSHADENCPFIPGADFRVAIPYDDPKVADGKENESEIYDLRCQQIAQECLYIFSLL